MKFNWEIIDPRITTRLWTVGGMNWYGGQCWSFWRKKSALKKLEEIESFFLYVDLINEISGEKIRVKDNPERICPPGVILERR